MEHDPDLEGRLRALGRQSIDPDLQVAHLSGMASAARSASRRAKARVGGIVVAGVLIGSTSLAAAGALPDPAQHVAHRALGTVGVDVPDPERYHGDECGAQAKRNHGAYVRDDHGLAQSRCGKPVHAGTGEGTEDGQGAGPKAAKGPCQGPPPWAGKDGASMTPEEKAQAQAQREATCGTEGEDPAEGGEGTAEQRQATAEAPGSTTTTTEATSTTTEATTTTVPATEPTEPAEPDPTTAG